MADSLGTDTDPETLSTRITARNEPNSVLIDVSVRAPDAGEAQRTATAFLSAFAERVNDLESVDGSVAPRAELVVVDPPDRPLHRSLFGVPIALILLTGLLTGAVLGALPPRFASSSIEQSVMPGTSRESPGSRPSSSRRSIRI